MTRFTFKGIIKSFDKIFSGIKAPDLDNKFYDGWQMRVAKDGTPVIVLRSKKATPAHWLVQKGMSSMYFRTHKEAMEYCDEHGYSVEGGGRK